MAGRLLSGPRHWEAEIDQEGYRTYKVVHLVECDIGDCPYTIMLTPGLPVAGSLWNFGTATDVWAFCYPDMRVSIHQEKEGDPVTHYAVEQKFSTRPINRCIENQNDNPLLEPDKISGSFVKYTEERHIDKDGNFITASNFEQFSGPLTEWDNNRPTVCIEQAVGELGLATFAAMVDRVNDNDMWGLPSRCIKLSNASWTRERYGSCNTYFTRRFEFDVNFDTFDRYIPDQGSKVLYGDPSNPSESEQKLDRNDNPVKVMLNGSGQPLTNGAAPIFRHVQMYKEANFLELGIPIFLG